MINDPKRLFVTLLSHVRQNEERTGKIFQELSQMAEDPDIKEALESRVFVEKQILGSLDQCFKLIGEAPVKLTGKLHDVFMEDLRQDFNEIQSPLLKGLYLLSKANQLAHLRMAEYVALIAMSDVTEHYGVGTLLESCLADKLAFAERTRRHIRNRIEGRVAERIAA